MKDTMADQMKTIQEERRLQGGFQSLWEVPLINEEQIHKLNPSQRFSIRTKLWLFHWYPILVIIFTVLSIIYYGVEIFKALN